MNRLTVIDFFCGAGGFSEGFRQVGFDIIYGYDHWKPAVDTYNHNFGLDCKVKNILDFYYSEDEIEQLPNTDVIIGSPPCVSFSTSNKSGGADKSLGIDLSEAYLRIIAVKKHHPESILKAWFMENVVNSRKYLKELYTFEDLNLTNWAKKYNLKPLDTAIDLTENTAIINSAEYGSYQARKRVLSGEIIDSRKLIVPKPTHGDKNSMELKPFNTLKKLKRLFPNPFVDNSNLLIKDIQYNIKLPLNQITDHFYDTGIYKNEWKFSKHWKVNHPFMGKMSFPENEHKPSRTITATKIANSRESIIYKSEVEREGDGEYRLPTVREAAIIMGFPVTYQFLGSEHTKWRLVGNAVCCSVSRAFAKTVNTAHARKRLIVTNELNINGVKNLNTFSLKKFNNPPIKNKGAKFRRHSIKDGNMTVTLSNYNILNKGKVDGKWYTSIQYGTGKGFYIQEVEDGYYKNIEREIIGFDFGKKFISVINNEISKKIAKSSLMQSMYENQKAINGYSEPTDLIDGISVIFNRLKVEDKSLEGVTHFKYKKVVPQKQLLALYFVNLISSVANIK